ncbi:MAG: hypothetical protein H6861_01795 [Rhodospirillales bacterium]|nr:hypothetical protein [Rhodospirillales bacterium]
MADKVDEQEKKAKAARQEAQRQEADFKKAREQRREAEKQRLKTEGNTFAWILTSDRSFSNYRPASFSPAVLTSDDERPAAGAVIPVAATGVAGAAVVAKSAKPETTETVMDLRGSDGQLIALDPDVLQGPFAAHNRFASNDPRLTLEFTGGKPIIADDDDSEEYGLWKDSGYYADHFKNGAELGDIEDALKNNTELRASWVEAYKQVYKMHNGEDVPKGWDEGDIVEDGLDYIREFNNNFHALDFGLLWTHGGMTNIAFKVHDGTNEQKQAFGFLMDTLDRGKNFTSGGTAELAQDMASDLTTYVSLGSFGVGAATAQAGKQATKYAVKQAVREALKQGTREAIKVGVQTTAKKVWNTQLGRVATIGAIEGAVWSAGSDAAYQATNISLGRQESYSLKQAAFSTATGSVTGLVMGGGMTLAGQKIVAPVLKKVAPKTHKKLSKLFGGAETPDEAAKKAEADAAKAAETPTVDEIDADAAKMGPNDGPQMPEDVAKARAGTDQPEMPVESASAPESAEDLDALERGLREEAQKYDPNTARESQAEAEAKADVQPDISRAEADERLKRAAEAGQRERGETMDTPVPQQANAGAAPVYNINIGDGAQVGDVHIGNVGGGAPAGTTRTADAGTSAPVPETTTKPGKAADDVEEAVETPEAETAETVTEKPEATDDAGAKTPEAEKPEATTAGVGEPKNAKKSADDEKSYMLISQMEPSSPEFKKIKDWGNQFLFRRKWVYDPYQGWKDYRALRVESAMTNPRPIIKPVVDYADGRMEKWG